MPRNNFYGEDTRDRKRYYDDECPICGERHSSRELPKKRRCDDDNWDIPEKC
jgi:hypothetical protein